jgi:hypothetical protein
MAENAPFLLGLSPVGGKPVHVSFDGGRPLTGDEVIERARWQDMHRYYTGAYDGAHGNRCSSTTRGAGCSRSGMMRSGVAEAVLERARFVIG